MFDETKKKKAKQIEDYDFFFIYSPGYNSAVTTGVSQV